MTPIQSTIDAIPEPMWRDIEVDINNDPLLLDRWALTIFPKSSEGRIEFRKLVRDRLVKLLKEFPLDEPVENQKKTNEENTINDHGSSHAGMAVPMHHTGTRSRHVGLLRVDHARLKQHDGRCGGVLSAAHKPGHQRADNPIVCRVQPLVVEYPRRSH